MVYRTELCGELSNELTITRSVSKIIFKPTEISNYISFLVSVTTDVVIELYHYIKKCSYSGKTFCCSSLDKKVIPTDGNETDLHNMEKKLLVKKVKLLGTAFPSAKYF